MPQVPADHAHRFEDEGPDDDELGEIAEPNATETGYVAPPPTRGRQSRQTPRQAEPAPVPAYLRDLIASPGVDPDALDNVPTGTAWVKIESANGAARSMPLAHLAPDALDTLAELGFEGHTTFEIRETQAGRVLRYFACRLEDLEPLPPENTDQAGAGAIAGDQKLIDLLTRQQMQINALQQQVQAGAGDPLAGLEKAFSMFDRFSKMLQRAMPPQIAAPAGGLQQILDVAGQVMPLFQKQQAQQEPDQPEEPNAA